jgi:hypothetical protein
MAHCQAEETTSCAIGIANMNTWNFKPFILRINQDWMKPITTLRRHCKHSYKSTW